MKDIILFDLDGTLSDPKLGITKSFQYALRFFNIDVENLDDLNKLIGPPLRQGIKDAYGFDDDKTEKAVYKFREYFADKGMYENTLYEGIGAMLQMLRARDKTLILATSKVGLYAERILSYFGIGGFFTFVSGAEMNGERSDKAEVIAYALEKNGISDLNRCIMVGDREHDIIGARSAGIESIGVLYGYGGFDELHKAGATYMVKDVSELSELLCKL